MKLYHGGAPGLDKRDKLLLPPSQTGSRSLADYGAGGVCRRDRVYLHVDADQAEFYAAMFPGGGTLYEVEAIGDLEPDPDWRGTPGESVQAPKARVVRALKRRVTSWHGMTQRQMLNGLRTLDGDLFAAQERYTQTTQEVTQ